MTGSSQGSAHRLSPTCGVARTPSSKSRSRTDNSWPCATPPVSEVSIRGALHDPARNGSNSGRHEFAPPPHLLGWSFMKIHIHATQRLPHRVGVLHSNWALALHRRRVACG